MLYRSGLMMIPIDDLTDITQCAGASGVAAAAGGGGPTTTTTTVTCTIWYECRTRSIDTEIHMMILPSPVLKMRI